MLEKLKRHARHLKAESYALYLAARDPRTPWYAKIIVAAVVAYACSPIDLIPDFIPVLGYVDDLILLPFGIALAIKLVPESVMSECRERAHERVNRRRPVSWGAGVFVIAIWIMLITLCIVWGLPYIQAK